MAAHQHDVERLHKAMAGMGTDDKELVEIIGGHTRQELVEIAAAYRTTFARSLKEDLKSDTSFHYKELLLSLIKPLGEYYADLLYESMAGAGTRESQLIDVLTMSSPAELAELKAAWDKHHLKEHGSITDAIKGDTSFNFKQVLLQVVRGVRMPPGHVDHATVEKDCETLYAAGEKRFGTDDDTFIAVLSRSSAEHMQAVSELYNHKYKHSLESAIEKETSGHYQDTLLALCTPRAKLVAKRIHHAVAGAGTDDAMLIRMFAMNDKAMLHKAAEEYKKMYKTDMVKDVAGDTSGDYKNLLIRLFH
jgi:hypothetical protein